MKSLFNGSYLEYKSRGDKNKIEQLIEILHDSLFKNHLENMIEKMIGFTAVLIK